MKFLLILLLAFCSCAGDSKDSPSTEGKKSDILETVRMQTKVAEVLFHHQVQKSSLVSRVITTKEGIDSIFTFIGATNPDTSCSRSGFYNTFGQVNLYADTSHLKTVAELHFVLAGECEGFYLSTKSYLDRYVMKPEGKSFFNKLYTTSKGWLE